MRTKGEIRCENLHKDKFSYTTPAAAILDLLPEGAGNYI